MPQSQTLKLHTGVWCCPNGSALALEAVFCRHESCPSSRDLEAWCIFVATAKVIGLLQNVLCEATWRCSVHMERHFLGQHDGLEKTNERKVREITTQNHEGGGFCVSKSYA